MFKQSAQHVGSYYAATYPGVVPLRPVLRQSLSCDVLIVGGGLAGLQTALRLAEAGTSVIVLEASRLAWAASGRNGGQALLGWSCDLGPLIREVGIERTRILWDSMCWAAEEMRVLPIRHGFEIDYRLGSLWSAVRPQRVALLREAERELREDFGYTDLRLIERDELQEWIGSPRYHAALYDARGAHLNPLKLAQGLADAIEIAGGQLFEQSQVLDIQGNHARTAHGEIHFSTVVLACNAYVDRLVPNLAQRVLPVGSYQVATVPLDAELVRSLLPRNSCVIDNQFVPDYFRLTPDNRLLCGGGCTYLGGMPKDIRAAMRPVVERIYPQLRGVELDFAWGGHIDVSMKRTPDVGRDGSRYWLQGFSGHGLLPTLAAAKAVSDALLGDSQLLDIYQSIRNPAFPGGQWLAAPLEAAGKAWYRLRDVI